MRVFNLVPKTIVLGMLACASLGTASAQVVAELYADGFTNPVLVTAPEGDERLFVVEQRGVVWIVDGASATLPTPFLNIDPLVTSGGERGLLGMAFHPDYETNGQFFVHYSSAETGKIGDTVLARYTVSGGNPDVANPGSASIFLEVDQPFSNHNGGMIAFRPGDSGNYLYMALGDGGSAGDPQNNAQNIENVLGKILRIDVDAGAPAAAPASNPYVGIAGHDLIWSYGLRNPWRFSFDRLTGDMYIGDVGQNSVEEIDFAAS